MRIEKEWDEADTPLGIVPSWFPPLKPSRVMQHPFRFRRLLQADLLLPLLVSAGGLLLCVTLYRLYGGPIVTADAAAYLNAAFSPAEWGSLYRTPAYGLVLRLGLLSGSFQTVLWIQIAVWCVLLFCIAWAAGSLLGSPFAGACIAAAFVLYDIQEMSLLPYHWHLLTESLGTSSLLLGFVGLAAAYLHRSRRLLYASCLCLGFTVWLKPVPVPILVALPAVWVALRPRTAGGLVLACALLAGPVASKSVTNAIFHGSWSVSPVGGLDLVSHAEALYKDGDRVFPDDGWNSRFAAMMRTGTWDGRDIVGFPTEHARWGAMRAFYDAYSGETELGPRVFAIARISAQTARRLAFLHPGEYVRNVASKMWNVFTLSDSDDLQWRHGFDGIVYRRISLLSQIPKAHFDSFRGLLSPSLPVMDASVVSGISILRFMTDADLISPRWHGTVVLLAAASALYAGYLCRSRRRPDRAAGLLILSLLLTAVLLTAVTAAIVYIESDSRYRVPVITCVSLAVFLAVGHISLRLQKMLKYSII
jgi:hypothetical protein